MSCSFGLIERRSLTAWLAEQDAANGGPVGFGGGDCVRLFGVGRLTLERIAAGEVEPEPDVALRIAAQTKARTVPSRPSGMHADGQLAAASHRGGGRFLPGRDQ